MKIAWIGVGVMARGMLPHLKKAGHEISLYTRSPHKIVDLEAEGYVVFDTIKDCIANADLVCTMVGYPRDVEEVYCSKDGILPHISKTNHAICIDFTTSNPFLAQKMATIYPNMMDVPVSGGDIGAKNGTLSMMCGGTREVFDEVFPILSLMGSTIEYLGPAGAGQHTKMANQIALAASLSGVCEAIEYACAAKLRPEQVLHLLSKGAAGSWQMQNVGAKIIAQDFQPGFFLKHFLKDLRIAQENALAMNLQLPVLTQVTNMVQTIVDQGYGDLSTAAFIQAYR